MVELLRQPSWSSACGFVDGGRTPRGRAFRPPAAHNSRLNNNNQAVYQ
jgi:hypothetical protein